MPTQTRKKSSRTSQSGQRANRSQGSGNGRQRAAGADRQPESEQWGYETQGSRNQESRNQESGNRRQGGYANSPRRSQAGRGSTRQQNWEWDQPQQPANQGHWRQGRSGGYGNEGRFQGRGEGWDERASFEGENQWRNYQGEGRAGSQGYQNSPKGRAASRRSEEGYSGGYRGDYDRDYNQRQGARSFYGDEDIDERGPAGNYYQGGGRGQGRAWENEPQWDERRQFEYQGPPQRRHSQQSSSYQGKRGDWRRDPRSRSAEYANDYRNDRYDEQDDYSNSRRTRGSGYANAGW